MEFGHENSKKMYVGFLSGGKNLDSRFEMGDMIFC